jgi:short-subunit dehydrogenase
MSGFAGQHVCSTGGMTARRALVTGASSGIGAAYAERLAADGWALVAVARRRDRLDALAKRLEAVHGAEVQVVEADLATANGLDRVLAVADDAPLDLLVNNAALAHYMPFAELPPEAARELVELNVLAPVLLSRAVVPQMLAQQDGAIVNVASLLAFSGAWEAPHMPKRAVYASTKSFLVTFTQVLAQELAGTGVRVQVLCPGVVRTEFHSRQGMDMAGRTRMEPDDVVAASLRDLEQGVVVSIPGLEDETALAAVEAAQAGLLGSTGAVAPASRYS